MPLQLQKNNRELEVLVTEAILLTIRENVPVERILRAYMDETEELDEISQQTPKLNKTNIGTDISANLPDIQPKVADEIPSSLDKLIIREPVSNSNLNEPLEKSSEKIKLAISEPSESQKSNIGLSLNTDPVIDLGKNSNISENSISKVLDNPQITQKMWESRYCKHNL